MTEIRSNTVKATTTKLATEGPTMASSTLKSTDVPITSNIPSQTTTTTIPVSTATQISSTASEIVTTRTSLPTQSVSPTLVNHESKSTTIMLSNNSINDYQIDSQHYHSEGEMINVIKNILSRCQSISKHIEIQRNGKTLHGIEFSNAQKSQSAPLIAGFIGRLYDNDAMSSEMLLQLVQYICTSGENDYVISELLKRTKIIIVPCLSHDQKDYNEENRKCSKLPAKLKLSQPTLGHCLFNDTWQNTAKLRKACLRIPIVSAMQSLFTNYSMDVLIGLQTRPFTDFESNLRTIGNNLKTVSSYLVPNELTETINNILSQKLCNTSQLSKYSEMKFTPHNFQYRLKATLSIGCCINPNKKELSKYWDAHQTALLEILHRLSSGISGKVVDRSKALIQHVNINITNQNGQSYTIPSTNGHFQLFLPPGKYSVKAQANGYNSYSLSTTVVKGAGTTQCDINLTKSQPYKRFFSRTDTLAAVAGLFLLAFGIIFYVIRTAIRKRKSKMTGHRHLDINADNEGIRATTVSLLRGDIDESDEEEVLYTKRL